MTESNATDKAKEGQAATSLTAIGRHAPVLVHTFSSQLSSAVSTCAFYPLDVIKTRFMSQDGTVYRQHNSQTYSSIARSLRVIVRDEGVPVLFRGCPTAVGGAVFAWGAYMGLYRFLCNLTEFTSYLGRTGVSLISSGMSTFLASPIFMLKSRMQIEEATKSANYRTFRHGLTHVVRTNGIRSLWRGVSLQLLLVFPSSLGLPTYDALKRLLLERSRRRTGRDRDLNTVEICACSGTSKILVLLLSHPLIVMKIRLQDQRSMLGSIQYRSALQSLRTIIQTQGPLGVYRGFSTALAHSLPRSILQYYLYEATLTTALRYMSNPV